MITDLDGAPWITHPDWAGDEPPNIAPVLRTLIDLSEQPVRARVTIAALGVWTADLDGRSITDQVLEPGTSDFGTRVATTSHDVTGLMSVGVNQFRLQLGEGSAHVRRVPDRYTKLVGRLVAPRARVGFLIDFADGRQLRITTGPDWQAQLGPTTLSHWYGGEDYDATREGGDWTSAVVVADADAAPRPWARRQPPMRVVESLAPVQRTMIKDSAIIDFGRNLAGREVITLTDHFPAGATVQIWPAEYLGEDGHVDQHSTGWPIFDSYRGRGGAACWRPQFCYHGFRFLEVRVIDADGGPLPATEELVAVDAERIMTDNRPVGSFSTSDPTLDGIHDLVGRAIDSNLFSVPTDCPHREKLGWLEQDHLVFEPVARRYHIDDHFADLITHMSDAQTADGLIPDIAPELVVFDIPTHLGTDFGYRDDVNWGSAIWQIPRLLHRTYADLEPARRAWQPGMAYLDYIDRLAGDDLLDHGLADWITLDDATPRALVASYGHARMLDAAVELAPLLGHDQQADDLRHRAITIRRRLAVHFVDSRLRTPVIPDTQASIALLLDLGAVLPATHQQAAEQQLLARIHADGDRFTVGEIGLPALIRQLTRLGEHELIRTMATRTDVPGYGQMLAEGCTALAEHWTGAGSRASANHFMLGYIDRWLIGSVAGLAQAPDDIGWRHAVIAPVPLAGVDWAATDYDHEGGRWSVRWDRSADRIRLQATVPAGAVADIVTPPGLRDVEDPDVEKPGAHRRRVGPGDHVITFG